MLDLYLQQHQDLRRRRTRQNSAPGALFLEKPTVVVAETPLMRRFFRKLSSTTSDISRVITFEQVDPQGSWRNWTSGSIQQSVVVAMVIAVVNGLACFLYYTLLEASLVFFWQTLPQAWGAPAWSIS